MDTMEKYRKYVNTACVKAVEPVVAVHAKGARIIDENGRTYTDLFAGISVVNAGHCNPEVTAAAKAQMDRLVHANAYAYHIPGGGRPGREAGPGHSGPAAEELLRQRRSRGQRRRDAPGQAVHQEAGIHRPPGQLPRAFRGDPFHHRQLRAQAGRGPLPAWAARSTRPPTATAAPTPWPTRAATCTAPRTWSGPSSSAPPTTWRPSSPKPPWAKAASSFPAGLLPGGQGGPGPARHPAVP